MTSDGFITDSDVEFMGRVVGHLEEMDPTLEAAVDHTGGGVFCIYVRVDPQGRHMHWGTADDVWGAEAGLPGGELDDEHHVFTEIPAAGQDAEAIARLIREHVQALRSSSK